MIGLTITYEKYAELHSVVSHPILGTELGAFSETFNCAVMPSLVGGGLVELMFDSEEDVIWFKLKWL